MTLSTCRRAVRIGAGALFVLLAALLYAPTSAQAGCHHPWLQPRGPHADAMLSELELFRLRGPSTPLPATPEDRSPCAGLSCSSPPLLPLVPATGGPVRGEDWGCLPTPTVPTPPGSFGLRDARDRVRPLRIASSIERPPRPLA